VNDSKVHFNLLFVMDIAANTMKVGGTLSCLIIYDKITHFYRWQKLMLFCGDISHEIEAKA